MSLLATETSYRQKTTLSEEATLEIRLEDLSQAEPTPLLITRATREVKSAPPYALQIAFPTQAIKAKHRYNLKAFIKVGEQYHFISTYPIDPFAVGITTPIEIKVDRIEGALL